MKTHESKIEDTLNIDTKDDNFSDPSHLLAAVEANNAGALGILLKNGADVNAKIDDDGYILLHVAAIRDAAETAEILLKNGADVNAKSDNGNTPLRLASTKNTHEVERVLRHYGGKKGWLW